MASTTRQRPSLTPETIGNRANEIATRLSDALSSLDAAAADVKALHDELEHGRNAGVLPRFQFEVNGVLSFLAEELNEANPTIVMLRRDALDLVDLIGVASVEHETAAEGGNG